MGKLNVVLHQEELQISYDATQVYTLNEKFVSLNHIMDTKEKNNEEEEQGK